MTLSGLLLGLALIGGVLAALLVVTWLRWKTRERKLRRLREQRRMQRRDDWERAARQLRLRVDPSGPRLERLWQIEDVPAAHALVQRLCDLQAEVVDQMLGHDSPHDCFCGTSGYWPLEHPGDFRNDGGAIDYIERATRAALAAGERAADPQAAA